MSWPFSASAAASCRVLFEVQRNGDSGSPRVAGSTRASRSLTRRGLVCLMDLRPPPGRRTRSETSRPASSSPTAFCTVERDIPVASATLAMPPRPIARASAAATIRHWRSLRWGNTMASLDAKDWSGADTPPFYFLRARIARIIPLRVLRAVDALRVELRDEVFEARGIVGELLIELEDRVARLRGGGAAGVVAIDLGHAIGVSDGSTAVKGVVLRA